MWRIWRASGTMCPSSALWIKWTGQGQRRFELLTVCEINWNTTLLSFICPSERLSVSVSVGCWELCHHSATAAGLRLPRNYRPHRGARLVLRRRRGLDCQEWRHSSRHARPSERLQTRVDRCYFWPLSSFCVMFANCLLNRTIGERWWPDWGNVPEWPKPECGADPRSSSSFCNQGESLLLTDSKQFCRPCRLSLIDLISSGLFYPFLPDRLWRTRASKR